MAKINPLNYDIKFSSKHDWIRYFAEYTFAVDLMFREIKRGEVSVVSLPLIFLVRHTMELGYKMNIIELNKVSPIRVDIKFKGTESHRLDILHEQFGDQMFGIFKKFNIDKLYLSQFESLFFKLSSLKTLLHQLDNMSYAFRYPVKNDGITPSFPITKMDDKSDIVNFQTLKEIYQDCKKLLKYSTDVVSEITNNLA